MSFFSPLGHFAVPLCSTGRAHLILYYLILSYLILFPYITFILRGTVKFTKPVANAMGFLQTWRSRIKGR